MSISSLSFNINKEDDLQSLLSLSLYLCLPLAELRKFSKKGLIRPRVFNGKVLYSLSEVKLFLGGAFLSDISISFSVLSSPKTSYNCVELFSGCGGLALGLSNSGFVTKALVEVDKSACSTLRLNRPDWRVLEGDLAELNSSGVFSKDEEFCKNVDLLAGGFPCQSFSYGGRGLGFGDSRGTLFFEMLRTVSFLKPKLVLGENVKGLLSHDSGRTFSTICHSLEEEGYTVFYKVLSSQFFDVSQKRDRLFIVGVRNDLLASSSFSLFRDGFPFPKERPYFVPLKVSLLNVPTSLGFTYPKSKEKILSLIPEGGNWTSLPSDLQKSYMGSSFYLGGGKTGIARRLSWGEPSLTLTCSPAQKQTERIHPSETRPLRVREYARIQSFPDSWSFSGSLSSQYKQIGNAVPVNLAYHVGKALVTFLDSLKT